MIINNSSESYKTVFDILRKKLSQLSLKQFINKADLSGNTAILLAAYRGNIFIVRSLIECGADIFVKNLKGLNVLHMAAQGNNPNLIIYFKKKYNVSILSKDNNGNIPLHWACYHSSEDAINFLLSYMEDINIQNNEGKTPLHIAIFTEKPSLIKKLLKKGGDIKIKDKEGKTPILYASEIMGAESRIVKILLSEKPQNNLIQTVLTNINDKSEKSEDFSSPKKYFLANIILSFFIFLFELDYLPKLYSIIFFLMMFLLLICFIYMMFVNPGTIEDSSYKNIDWLELVFNDVNVKNMCPYCKVKREKLSRHCFNCHNCIKAQNYHCNIINNCIGENNSIEYIFFLVLHILIFIYICFISIKIFFIYDINILIPQFTIQINFLHNQIVKNITSILFFVIGIVGIIISFIITLGHIRQMVINSKIIELMEGK